MIVKENYYSNGIEYQLQTEIDSWISIYKWDSFNGIWQPLIQAVSMKKAKEYIEKREELNFVAKKI